MDLIRKCLARWPVARQLAQGDPVALRDSARSANHVGVRPRTETADRVVRSICPYCEPEVRRASPGVGLDRFGLAFPSRRRRGRATV
jgi:hypothetical protein